jgi:hypothetical protein
MSSITTITVKKSTRKKLEQLKLTKHETMDEVINRLIEAAVGSAAQAGEGPRLNPAQEVKATA